jgi:hypothetical protein
MKGVFMRRSVIILIVLLSVSFANAQEINFINSLADKKVVSFEDGVKMFIYTLGKAPAGFDADVAYLKSIKLLKAKKYDKNKPLSRGMLALMVARHLKLKGSLFFLIFDTERYAHRACVAENIMPATTSELDRLTGDELLEVMAMVGERMEGKK